MITAWFAYEQGRRAREESNKLLMKPRKPDRLEPEEPVTWDQLEYPPGASGGVHFYFPHSTYEAPIPLTIEQVAKEVFDVLGSGHSEAVYESAMEVELLEQGYKHVRRQVPCPIIYKGYNVGTGFIDILIDEIYVLELKAVAKLTSKDEAQLRRYLDYDQEGTLINFNPSTGKVEVIYVGTYEDTE